MKILLGAGAASLALLVAACSTPAGLPSMPDWPPPTEAPTGYDGRSNGMVSAATHRADQRTFEDAATVAQGLGPLYSARACSECHQSPVTGGVSQVLELRVGHTDSEGRFRDPEIRIDDGSAVIRGRSLVNGHSICPNARFPYVNIQEHVPSSENIRALHTPLNLLGDGLVEAVADETFRRIARRQCRSTRGQICGQTLAVPVLEAPGTTRIGRFGWKDQHASLLSFAGDSALNEMGITNSLFPEEVTRLCNTAREPNDWHDVDGLEDIERFARFIRATKPASRDARLAADLEARRGARLFARIGCDTCHVDTLITVPAGTRLNGGRLVVPVALGNRRFHPYSDYLLHDIGTGDGIVMALHEHYGPRLHETRWPGMSRQSAFEASARRMRTAALWGLRTRGALMHDGASRTLHEAILRHRGEAWVVTRRYQRLSEDDEHAIEVFLRSL
jgi:CxxC motif-containing protein (DUF1111 family)